MAEVEISTDIKFTPTWVVAAVCSVIIAISFAVERGLHYTGKYFKKTGQKPLYEALQKVKEELMLLGFISLLLTVFQGAISKLCAPEKVVAHMLPCKLSETEESSSTVHISGPFKRLLSEGAGAQASYCAQKNQVPLLSVEALHHLHIFIFVLAIVHVTFCATTVLFGGARIRQWKHWEDSITKDNYDTEQALKPKITHVQEHTFIQENFKGVGKRSAFMGWLHSFFKQFYASVTKSDYTAMRHGFIMTHCRGNPKFNFHKYMIRALEDDFKHVLVSLGLRDDILIAKCWHTYFWIAFVPFILLFSLGTKLEHVIIQLAHEVAEKHVAIEGDLVLKPSDDHFWFHSPRLVLFLIHFILFQNSFEIAYFFWIWVQYGFGSCIMGKVVYIVPRLIIGLRLVLMSCSFVGMKMGSNFKRAIFDEHVQVGLIGWAQKAKKKKGWKVSSIGGTGKKSPGSSSTRDESRGSHIETGPAEPRGESSSRREIQLANGP
ncbi:hypothetical protein V2J09_022077 [Rumex salicifolius]